MKDLIRKLIALSMVCLLLCSLLLISCDEGKDTGDGGHYKDPTQQENSGEDGGGGEESGGDSGGQDGEPQMPDMPPDIELPIIPMPQQ